MRKALIIIVGLIICVACVMIGVFWLRESEAPSSSSQETSSQSSSSSQNTPNSQDENNHRVERNEVMNKIFIRGEEYKISYDNNETVQELRKTFPLTVTMDDLNDNEKYVYLDSSLPTSAKKVGRVEAGDVMLFGDNCLVMFYKSFDTGYSYTKIGHIDELKLETGNSVEVEFR